jgi:putative ABC transport system permease protein
MFRNYLVAALNNLARNRLFAAVSIAGLAIGMAAAILTGLYVRDELTFDRFIPGYRNVYVVITEFRLPGRPPMHSGTVAAVAPLLKLDFRQVQAAARLGSFAQPVGVRRGQVETLEKTVAWADPDLFVVLPLPVLAGDPVAALRRPDAVVITRAMARKLFGQDAPIGQVLELNHAIRLRVGAVLKDLPANTSITQQIFASGLNAASPLRAADAKPVPRGSYAVSFRTYVRLAGPEAAARLQAGLPPFFTRRLALPNGKMPGDVGAALRLIPLDGLHFTPGVSPDQGSRATLSALGLIAVLILGVAGINFVNLMTARAARRAVEVGVRKVAGAQRGHLVAQFVGEAVIQALMALVLALVAVELVLPGLRALLDRPLDFAYWRDPAMLAACLALSLVVGVLAGLYPALVLSSFRPATVMKGGLPQASGSGWVRSGLATLQFAVLIGLILAVMVIGRQTHFALNEGLRVDKAQMVMLDITSPGDAAAAPRAGEPKYRDAFLDQVRKLPGVLGAACSSSDVLDIANTETTVLSPNGDVLGVGMADVDYGFFELYGLEPVAGRFFSRSRPDDEHKVAVINQKAATALGFASAAWAVGRSFRSYPSKEPIQIVGVVPDFAFDLSRGAQQPVIYTQYPSRFDYLSIKLKGKDIPETLRAIDALWKATGAVRPASRQFVDQYLQTVYASTLRQGYLIDALCGVAVFIACLGLFALAAFTAERRTKEIGVRKAMGASKGDILRLLLWQFARPVLWANLIAWPLGWWAMDRWLHGFSQRIALSPGYFLAAGAAAVAIAWLTVSWQSFRVARAKPVSALRYE